METRIASRKGWHRLLVADAVVNRLLGATQKEPIVLAMLSTQDGADLSATPWHLMDWRMTMDAMPSRYFSTMSYEVLKIKGPDVYERLKMLVPIHTVKNDHARWSTFDGVCPGPLQVEMLLKNGEKSGLDQVNFVDPARLGVWLFKDAMDQMKAIQSYWAAVEIKDEADMDAHRLPNPHRQISELSFSMSEYAIEARNTVRKTAPKAKRTP